MIQIALVGLGTVGSGVYEQILQSEEAFFQLKRVVVKDQHKLRPIGFSAYLSSWEEVVSDDAIDIVIELTDDELFALQVAKETLRQGKHLISANKKMLAKNIKELQQIADEKGCSLFYEAAVCGSIPIILLLQHYFLNNAPKRIRTIANGTSNYILSTMWDTKNPFQKILKDAQIAGFAESDPTDDLAGYDIKSKLTLIIWNAFNTHINSDDIPCFGIHNLRENTVAFLKQKGLKLKLIGEVINNDDGLLAYVTPIIISSTDPFFNVSGEQNVVEVENKLSQHQLFQGKGAGRYPTTQAVLADLQAVLSRRKNSVSSIKVPLAVSEEKFIFLVDQEFRSPYFMNVEVLYLQGGVTFVVASFSEIKRISCELGDIFISKISTALFRENFT